MFLPYFCNPKENTLKRCFLPKKKDFGLVSQLVELEQVFELVAQLVEHPD